MNDFNENLTADDIMRQSDAVIAMFGRFGRAIAEFENSYVADRKDQTPSLMLDEQAYNMSKILLEQFAAGAFNKRAPHTVNNMTIPGME